MKSAAKKKVEKTTRSAKMAKSARAAKPQGAKARAVKPAAARPQPAKTLAGKPLLIKPLLARPQPAKPRPASSLNRKQLDAYKSLLLVKKKGLTEAYNKNKTYGRLTEDEGTQDLADKASSAYTKEFLYSLSNTDREVLQKVDEALARLDRGEFGTCGECSEELNRRRLEAVPWASHCVVCQEKIEKGLL